MAAKYFEVHPHDPQPRAIGQVAQIIRDGGLIAYPTDSCFALGCQLGSQEGLRRIIDIRQLDPAHHFTLVCHDFAQMGHFVTMSNAVFRAVKAATPGPYTFILPASRDVPKRAVHPKTRTVGVRIPDHRVVRALLAELGEPLVSSTLLLPGQDDPMTEAWQVQEALDQQLDAIVDGGESGLEPTTVVDLSGPEPVILRRGLGDPARFE